MSKLNRDILYLIFEELQNDKKTLYSSLSVNKTWSEIIILILWRNPWKYLNYENEDLIYNVIISHLSDETKNNLKIQGINLSTVLNKKLLFNYISFCRHLNLNVINKIFNTIKHYCLNSDLKAILKNEIYYLFINENTRFTYLYIPQNFDCQIHLIPGAKHCFSEISFLSCYARINDNVLFGLAEICQSTKELELIIELSDNNRGINKFVDAFKNLIGIRLANNPIVHTVQSIEMNSTPPVTAPLVNLKKLELNVSNHNMKFNFLENMSLPSLQILKSNMFQIKALRNLIVNTNGNLTKISIGNMLHNVIDNKNIIKAIYQNCPNLMYLKLMFRSENILELEQLLINCQHLNGLYFLITNIFDWDKLFEILTLSSPTCLFKFKFNIIAHKRIELESLKLFFDSWKGRNPMLLQIDSYGCTDLFNLTEEYKLEGIIKKFCYLHRDFEDFEW
jgi:hypothetical protein